MTVAVGDDPVKRSPGDRHTQAVARSVTRRISVSSALLDLEGYVSATVLVHPFPRSDDTFAHLVEDSMLRFRPRRPEVLAALIRASYPSARIVARSTLGALGGPPVWYAYRDGTLMVD